MSKILNDILSPLDSITEGQYRQFEIYKDLLLEWNQKMNLTAISHCQKVAFT